MEIDYRFNGETRKLKATHGVCPRCHVPVLWVKVSWYILHSADPLTHKSHYPVCPATIREQEVYMRKREERQPRQSTAFEDTAACDMMDARDGWDDDNDW